MDAVETAASIIAWSIFCFLIGFIASQKLDD